MVVNNLIVRSTFYGTLGQVNSKLAQLKRVIRHNAAMSISSWTSANTPHYFGSWASGKRNHYPEIMGRKGGVGDTQQWWLSLILASLSSFGVINEGLERTDCGQGRVWGCWGSAEGPITEVTVPAITRDCWGKAAARFTLGFPMALKRMEGLLRHCKEWFDLPRPWSQNEIEWRKMGGSRPFLGRTSG